MNRILAQYLFTKETIYRNPPSTEIPVQKIASQENTDKAVNISVPSPTSSSLTPDEHQIPKPVSLKPLNAVTVITENITLDEKNFLSKILAAVGLSLTQIDLVDINQTGHTDYSSVFTQKIATKFISFGVGPSKLHLDLDLVPYQIRTESGIDFLMANSLNTVSSDTGLKKNLWAALQLMFGK